MSLNRKVPAWTLVFALLPVLAGVLLATRTNERYDGPRFIAIPDCRHNLRAIQLAVERYCVDHGGVYPPTVQAVFDAGYIREYPRNPYWRHQQATPAVSEKMRLVPPGQHEPGGFSYIPRFAVDAPGETPAVTGYALLVYCNAATARRMRRQNEALRCPLPGGAEQQVAWDHVLLVLSGGEAVQAP